VITWTPTEAQGPSVNTFETIVTDNGTPALRATNTFTVTVTEVNSAPVLPTQADRTINELSTLTVTNTATDADLPANVLIYQLVSPPAGASINGSGVITWTPTEAQGPSVNTFETIVTDNGTPALRATNFFTVTVTEVNSAPVLTVPGDQAIKEIVNTLVVTNRATDPDLPPNTLTFNLVSAPTGVTLDSHTGVLSWTPTEAQGPGAFMITVKVTDNGTPPLSDTGSFRVIVSEINSVPALAVPPDQTIDELSTLVVTNTAGDADLPANTLSFSLVSAPSGVSLDAVTGVLTWTPTEAQGPSENRITVKVTDNGSPPLSDTRSFAVSVREVNSPPVLAPPSDHLAVIGNQLTITNSASDTDLPPNTLTFSLDPGAPAGAVIDPVSGVSTWTPTANQGPETYVVTVRVTDDGIPGLSDARTIRITVVFPPVIESIVLSGETVALSWSAIPGQIYRVQFKSDPGESTWGDLPGDVTADGPTAVKTDLVNGRAQRFYRVVLLQY